MRTALQKIKEFVRRKKREHELKAMDSFYFGFGVYERMDFPPSFYATHTEEEIREAQEEQLKMIEAIIEKYSSPEMSK